MFVRRLLAAAAVLALTTSVAACGAGAPAGPYPSEDLSWTIAFGPGGGNDLMARTMVDIVQREGLYPGRILVENREGGSGASGWGHVYGQSGSGYEISTTSGSFITTPLQADTGWQPTDFTPVGLLASDHALLVTAGTAPWRTLDDWVAHARERGSAVVGGIGTVNVDFIVQQMIAEAKGYRIEYVPFNDEGQMQTALLSGAIEAMVSNPGSIMGQVEAGQVTPLTFTGGQRLPALEQVPTTTEAGIPDVPSMPRGLILPPGAPPEAQAFWVDAMQKVTATPEWQRFLDENHLIDDQRWGPDFTAYLQETQEQFRAKLTELGAL
ncbi:Bug family tripartite tricarboxylate transporter substrate binding protein [Pseudonocardia sp. HH130630-07]|uniref:Bug family tripartite tricarboxylate transporter substrate binding protein n=1 Tax=Pseudonocardia sp. HH130630-07 TaxID=1690815 RepID=UPI0008150F02|nr:tripartite tricarboxylate transporter substrate binding protein [Pseudonocardia sp. HH130630-07]ANY07003.1 transporter [Pseudonocardia sp. HH130630-07]